MSTIIPSSPRPSVRPSPRLAATLALFVLALVAFACAGPSPEAQEASSTEPTPLPAAEEGDRRGLGPVVACDDDDGGLELPEGFCARVFADDLGEARHLAVASDGTVYVALRRPSKGGAVVALRDTDGDWRSDVEERFGPDGGTGIAVTDGHLWFAPDDRVLRWARQAGELVPSGDEEVVVSGFPRQRTHAAKPFVFDESGHLYVTSGAPSNACQERQRTPGSPGLDPCPQLERGAGLWRFSAFETGQDFDRDGTRFATGIRHIVASAWNPQSDAVYVVQHGRDQLHQLYPDLYTVEQSAELPAEELLRVNEGDDFGWPYCYWDQTREQKILAPEYGGDGVAQGRCADIEAPEAAFPGHWAPNDLLFYYHPQFPEPYRGGAFIAFHGSWNRAPLPQRGYQVVFVPFEDGRVSGEWSVFADGFKGRDVLESPGQARWRPMGLAVGPDGALFITDSVEGRVWRVVWTGEDAPVDEAAG